MQTCLAIAFNGFQRQVFLAFEMIVKRPLRLGSPISVGWRDVYYDSF